MTVTIVDLKKTLASLQITVPYNHTDAGNKSLVIDEVQEQIKHKKLDTDYFLVDMIRKFGQIDRAFRRRSNWISHCRYS